MLRLSPWQWFVLGLPIVAIALFLLIAAGMQIHAWGLSWIWAVVTLILLGWRWLLVHWTRSQTTQIEALIAQVSQELGPDAGLGAGLESNLNSNPTPLATDSLGTERYSQALQALKISLTQSQDDPPLWENWPLFGQRCLDVVGAIAHIYHPEVKYPLLNIYIPQAYGLIRDTVDDLDLWMQKLSPALSQLTVAQARQGYEIYRKLEPSARKLWQAWGWARWLLNPAAAIARTATRSYTSQANQQLLLNLSQLLREAALRQLAQRAIQLYSGATLPPSFSSTPPASPPSRVPSSDFRVPTSPSPLPQTQTLRDLLAQATPPEQLDPVPVNLLVVGRTGAGKSSLINTLFGTEQAEVDVLPSTSQMQRYTWHLGNETLSLWDSPGYEQVQGEGVRSQLLAQAAQADLILLLSPALDPALAEDRRFLAELRQSENQGEHQSENQGERQSTLGGVLDDRGPSRTMVLVTQVDRVRPLREWSPPYDWVWGDRPKERAIREATQYRLDQLGGWCDRVLPLVNGDERLGRASWGMDAVAAALLEAIAPAKQARLARFLRDLDARAIAATQIIERYSFQMSASEGLTVLLKSPVLQFLSTLTTGTPTLGTLLAAKIPAEQIPLVIGKLQLAYDLFSLLNPQASPLDFNLLSLWPLITDHSGSPERNAWALGQTLVEYWIQQPGAEGLGAEGWGIQGLAKEELRSRFEAYRLRP